MMIRQLTSNKRLLVIPFFLLLILLAVKSASAQENTQNASIGKVIVTVGDVQALSNDGTTRKLRRRSDIYNGDTVVTGKKARIQMRFSDGSLLALKPETEFRIDDYRFSGEADDSENAAYSLLKGGMRTISGAIGRTNKDNYKINTPVATIGIRGTHFILQQCNGNCGQKSGLYGAVVNGAIAVTNRGGDSTIGMNQFFHVSNANSRAQLLPKPPAFLLHDLNGGDAEKSDDQEQGDMDTGQQDMGADEQEEESGDTAVEDFTSDSNQYTGGDELSSLADDTSAETLNLDTTQEQQIADDTSSGSLFTPAPQGAIMGIAFSSSNSEGYDATGGVIVVDDETSIGLSEYNGASNIPFDAYVVFPARTWTDQNGATQTDPGCNPCTFSPGSANLVDVGGVGGSGTGINWGRWAGGYIITSNGELENTLGSMHYIYSPNATPYSTVSSLTGSVTYNNIGGTSPTDEQGVAGSLSSASINVDFGAQEITSASLSLTVNGKSISVSNSSTVSIQNIYTDDEPIPMSGTCSGGSCGGSAISIDGDMSLQFVGPNAERALSSYGLQNTQTSITGTVALE